MKLDAFQKHVLFIVALVLLLGGAGLGASSIIMSVQTRREAARVREIQRRVERVMALNVCAHFTDGERARLDKVDKDPLGTKNVLLAIMKERRETWAANTLEAVREVERYQRLNAIPVYVNYLQEIRRERERAQEAYREFRGFERAITALEKLDPMGPLDAPAAPKPEPVPDPRGTTTTAL